MFLRILIKFTRKNLVGSQNKYEYSKFDKDFMLFYYKKLNKIAISKEIIANLGNCNSIIFKIKKKVLLQHV